MSLSIFNSDRAVPHLAGSDAFRVAALRSEIRRAYIVMGVMALLALMIVRPDAPISLDWRLIAAAISGISVICGLQLVILRMARRALGTGTRIPEWFTILTAVVESLVPTAIIFVAMSAGALPGYAALSAPPILAYGSLVCLMALRLRPGLCVLAGGVSAGGYGLALACATARFGPTPATGLPRLAYLNSSFMIFIAGLAAAWVAREIRTHVEAALGEAETRRKMALIEQDIAVARSIQQALLPRAAPSIAGFDIAGWNRPADQTGGDYYDWQPLPDGNWIVTLADVSGHGIGPAMVTAACRAYVRASSLHHADLASLTGRVNRLLADDLPEGRFVTMVSVLIDPRTGDVGLLSAGHGPIVVYVGATGAVRDILPRDPPLAVLADAQFAPAQSLLLAPGDVLALVTDGFVEWSRPGVDGRREQFGLERLRESLRHCAGRPAAEIVQAVAADVAAFADGHPQQDDLTIVVIKAK